MRSILVKIIVVISMNFVHGQSISDDAKFKEIEDIYLKEDSINTGRNILEICLSMSDKQPSQHLRRTANWYVAVRMFTSPSIHFPGTLKLMPESPWINRWKKRGGPILIKTKLIERGYLSKDGLIDRKPRISKEHVCEFLKLYDSVMM